MTTGFIAMPTELPPVQPLPPDSTPLSPSSLKEVFQGALDLGNLPPAQRSRSPGWLWVSFGVMAVVALAGWYWWPRSAAAGNDVVGTATRGDLEVTVLDWGELESAKSVE